MGQILSQPLTEKTSESHGDNLLHYGLSCMQGWRVTMEDSHTTILNLNSEDSSKEIVSLFAVFDGHGGDKVALFTGEKIGDIIKSTDSYKTGNYSQALIDGFLATDVELLQAESLKNDKSGCAATSCIITKSSIICGNAGDSRTIMSVGGIVKNLSFDHKPTNEGEKARICAAGGYVDLGRVNGNLALSRGIGDFEFKQSKDLPPEEQAVTALPDIIEHIRSKDDEFVVLACDGIWDCLTSQQVVDFVRRGIKEGNSLTEICEVMMDTCLAPTSTGSGIGCDNMSVCIVALLQENESLDQWYSRISNKMANDEPLPSPDELSLRIHDASIESKFQQSQPSSDDNAGFNDDITLFSRQGGLATSGLIQLLAGSNVTTSNNITFFDSSSSSILNSIRQVDTEEDEEEEEEEDNEEDSNDTNRHSIEEVEE